MNRWPKALFALLALAAQACDTDRTSAAEAASTFCTTSLAVVVTHQATCRAASESFLDRRTARLPESCEILRRSVLEGRVLFDRARSAACAASLREAYADAACDAPPADPESCRAVYRPLVPHGGACTQPADCIDGWCVFPDGSCPRPGVCVPLGDEDDACDPVAIWPATHDSCRAGLRCDWTFTCSVPAAPVSEGSTCGVGVSCASGLHCQAYGGLRDPECRPVVGLGEPCPSGAGCAAGLVCNRYTACARYVGVGSSCAEVTAVCGDGLFCNDDGVCEAYPEAGEACTSRRGCLDGHCSSVDSRCHPYARSGDPCPEPEACEGDTHACVDGVCVPRCPGW